MIPTQQSTPAGPPQPGRLRDADLPASVWRAGRLSRISDRSLPSGFAALDAALPGGGWPAACVTELICREPGIGELRLLAPLLSRLTQARRFVILLAPPLTPYAPALEGFGIDLDYLIVIQAPHAADRLWAIEQSLKSTNFGLLIAWMPQARTRPEHLRRLQYAAQSATGPVILFRALAAQFEPSPAPLRMLLLPRPGQQLSIQLIKRRGPLIAAPITLNLPQSASLFGLRPTLEPSSRPLDGATLPDASAVPGYPSMQTLYAQASPAHDARRAASHSH